MTEIKYELTNLDDTKRAMVAKGTHENASGYEEVWLGNHSGLDVWAGVDLGNYPTYGASGIYLNETYTAKQLKSYSNYLSPYTLQRIIAGEVKPNDHDLTWTLADVSLYFYVMNTEVAESYLLATKQEIGFCPEANIVALDEPQAFGVLDVIKNAMRGNVSLFDYAVNKALVEAKSLASDISRKLGEK
jgi:hypothetical protein